MDKNHIDRYATLCAVVVIGSVFNFALLPLVPSGSNLKEWKRARNIHNEELRDKKRQRRIELFAEEEKLLKELSDRDSKRE